MGTHIKHGVNYSAGTPDFTPISYASFMQLSEQEKNNGSWLVTGMNPMMNAYNLSYKNNKTVGGELDTVNASLTDNGKSFKFGYDTTSSAYGYYTQEGDFMSFGSGDAKYVVSAHYSVITSYYWEDIMQLQYNNGGVDFEGKTWSAQGNISTFDNDYLTFTSSYTISPVDVSITIAAKHDCTVYSSISVLPIQISAGDTEVISLGDFRNHGNRGGIAIVFYD